MESSQRAHRLGRRLVTLPYAPADVNSAVNGLFCMGAKAKAKSVLIGVTVLPSSGGSFRYQTKAGDRGVLAVTAHADHGSHVAARATNLYVGGYTRYVPKKGLWVISHLFDMGLYRMLGVTPMAVKMKRFQNALEGRLSKELAKVARPVPPQRRVLPDVVALPEPSESVPAPVSEES